MSNITTHNLGYPRIGEHRELKFATESYWKGNCTLDELFKTGAELRKTNWLKQKSAGIDLIPCGDFSFYDHVLDTTCMVGNVPPRFHWNGQQAGPEVQFLIARGKSEHTAHSTADKGCCQSEGAGTFASEMTKWFDTNYHYIVPEFSSTTNFSFASNQVIEQFREAKSLGIQAKPVLLGPVTYLTLGKVHDSTNPQFNRFDLFEKLLPVYETVLQTLEKEGATWVQLDEPILVMDLSNEQKLLLSQAYKALKKAAPKLRLLLATYFGDLRDNLELACSLEFDALHIDAVRAADEAVRLAKKIPAGRVLSLGVVNGRNVWKTDYQKALELIRSVRDARPDLVLWLAPSCSLIHSPITLRNENKLDDELKNWLAFADEKLAEINDLRNLIQGTAAADVLAKNQKALESRHTSRRIHNPAVKKRIEQISASDYRRKSPFPQRQKLQHAKLKLPLFPTTTIGSFPQTQEVRAARARWRSGQMSDADYETFIKEQIRHCVKFQDDIGIDMPVHGEFERNDMVEYFGEQLEGFAFTQNGWVQSYGSRYVKPPLIFGDVSRPKPMTIEWSRYAQSLTKRPMKGMLTGPVTILQWSFYRDDLPREQIATQIALAIRDEVADLEKAGIAAIQIDEPAFREGLPLRKSDWPEYLRWAVNAFRLSASAVKDDTQIHTHMCYSEFNDIIQSIADLDADVITIETSRSNMELLDAFVNFKYPNEIGPGVYDIHSPRVPEVSEMINLMKKAAALLPKENLWVNPDCGLKTRRWEEVRPSLINMVKAAETLRKECTTTERLVHIN